MTGRDATTSFAVTLVDEWARGGVTHAVVAPGSRSAPLALALARDPRLHVDVVLDERSAAFRALGIGLASGRPAVVLCTSGTAAANFHPAVVEASYGNVPLLVCTADRPPELQGVGAGQTIDQTRIYGDAPRWFCDPGQPVDEPGAPAVWRSIAARSVAETMGARPGPVHLNVPFREPLVPTGEPLVDAPGRADGGPWTRTVLAARALGAQTVVDLAALVRAHPHGVLVAGWGAGVSAETAARFAAAAGWPIFADPLSQLRCGPHAVSTYEALVRHDSFARSNQPTLVVRVGAPPTSKVLNAWLSEVPQVLFDAGRAWLDPTRSAHQRIEADADAALDVIATALGRSDRSAWLEMWSAAERDARTAMDATLDAAAQPFEGLIARDLAAALPDGATLVVASSLAVRALEWCMAPRSGLRILANRGVNGIDGFTSTVLGVATASFGPTVALCGDLCFLHDTNGLLAARGGAPATIVVIDNDGGGIFSFLPPAELEEFESLFGTRHGLDLVAVARAHGVSAQRVDDVSTLPAAIAADETRVLVIPVDRALSVARHRALWESVSGG